MIILFNIGIIGAGHMGTAISEHLARNGFNVKLWVRREKLYQAMQEKRINVDYFPNYKLNRNILFLNDLKRVVDDSNIVIFALPSRVMPEVLDKIKQYDKDFKNIILLSTAKGLLVNPIRRVTECIKEHFPEAKVAALSGPNIAAEVLRGLPTTTTIAAEDDEVLLQLKKIFETRTFKVYLTKDLTGTELCGSLKNVITIGVGLVNGLELGEDIKGIIVAEGFLEMKELIIKMGGQESTLYSPAGLQDLLVASFSGASRNYKLGTLLGQGYSLERIIKEFDKITFEGQKTAKIAYDLTKQYNVKAPLVKMVYSVVSKKISAQKAFEEFWSSYTF